MKLPVERYQDACGGWRGPRLGTLSRTSCVGRRTSLPASQRLSGCWTAIALDECAETARCHEEKEFDMT